MLRNILCWICFILVTGFYVLITDWLLDWCALHITTIGFLSIEAISSILWHIKLYRLYQQIFLYNETLGLKMLRKMLCSTPYLRFLRWVMLWWTVGYIQSALFFFFLSKCNLFPNFVVIFHVFFCREATHFVTTTYSNTLEQTQLFILPRLQKKKKKAGLTLTTN